MEIHSSTAAHAPSAAADATSGPRPVANPQTTEISTIAVQITLIVMVLPPFIHFYVFIQTIMRLDSVQHFYLEPIIW